MSRRALAAAALVVLGVSRVDAQTVVFRTLNATLNEGSLAGTRFPVGISYDADQVAQVGESFVPVLSFDFTLRGVKFTRHDIFQGGQVIFENGAFQNVTVSFQVILPPDSPVTNITFGFGGAGVIGYADRDNQIGSGSFTIQSSGWNSVDIGDVGIAGSAVFENGVWTVQGAGGDIWGATDAFQFLYRAVNSDSGHLMVRVDDVQNTNPFAKAGVILRATPDVDAATVILDVKPNSEVEFMSRPFTGGEMVYWGGTAVSLPAWLQLAWQNGTVTASVSQDAANWTTVGGVSFTLPSTYDAGVAVTGHDTTQLNTAHVEGLSLLPGLWTSTDIGSPGLSGSAVEQFDDPQTVQDSFTVQGAGADIWGFGDAFQFVYQVETSFAASVQAHVETEQPTDPDAKVGVMIRDGLAPGAAFVILDMKPNGEIEFMQRFSPRGEVTFLGSAMVGLKPWLRLVRHEPTDLATVTAAVSADGVTWTVLGQTFVNMSMSVEMGIAVTSHDTTQLNTAVIDHVHVGNGEP